MVVLSSVSSMNNNTQEVVGWLLLTTAVLFALSTVVFVADRGAARKHELHLARIQALQSGVDPVALYPVGGSDE